MIRLDSLGNDYQHDRIFKKFAKTSEIFKTDGLIVKLNTTATKHIYGMIYVPPLMGSEIGNFSISKDLQTHPYWDYVDIPTGPQITWFTIYKKHRNKGASISVYEGLIKHFGALYSDHSQTIGGTAIWKKLIKRKNVNVYCVKWRINDWKITTVRKQSSPDIDSLFNETDVQTILVAIPINKEIKEFTISDVEESIKVAYRE